MTTTLKTDFSLEQIKNIRSLLLTNIGKCAEAGYFQESLPQIHAVGILSDIIGDKKGLARFGVSEQTEQ